VALGIKASDSMSGQVPAIRIINRPSNIDVPDWTGSGTMSVDPTTPAWAAYAALCHPKYGRGISPAWLNRAKWEEWIAWTEGLVGGNRRAQFNGVFDGSPASLKTALNHIENVGRAKIIPIGQTYSVIIDKPNVARGLYTYGKIIPDTFKIQWIPKEDKVDEIEIEYYDRERNYDAHSVYARSSAFDNLDRPARSTKITLIGCNNKDQAEREALLRMQKTELTTRIVQFSVPVEAVVMEPGAVIMVQHDSNKHTFGGLLGLDVNGITITLDRAVTLPASVFGSGVKLWVRDPDDNILERSITGPFDVETQTLGLDAALTAARFDPYAIGRPNEEKWLYRITKLDIEKNETCAITAVEYVEAAYYHADYESGSIAI
jgi:predicted phage tail protein